jgi:RNA polymerase sigma-70 factor (ECF subfamily)
VGVSAVQDEEREPAGSEADVLARARAGNDAALREIYDRHAASITRRLAHATGDPELARDLTQDAFVTAFDRIDRFRGDSSLGTWLHAIAFNHLRDRRKKARREQSLWERLRGRPPLSPIEPDRELQAREDLARLQAALAQLPDVQRDAFVLRVVEQLSLEEAAAILGARVATVSYRARRAEDSVRAYFEKGPPS